VQSVRTALDLLDCFMGSDELGVSDVARKLGVAKSTAHRLLITLAGAGMVDKNPQSGRYRLGIRIYELGTLAANRNRLRSRALPVMEELRQLTGHTVHLSVADGADVVHLERLQSMRRDVVLVDMRRRFPVHSTSGGKAIAALNGEVADSRRRAGFTPLADGVVAQVADFDRELAEVRRCGYAVNRGEVLRGVTSMAAPILDTAGIARAAISVAGLSREIDPNSERIARLVMAAARRIGQSLPWAGMASGGGLRLHGA
jgi:DNA-binding IclR family transcriptional regulator